MAIDYDKLAATALRLIGSNGRAVTLLAPSEEAVDENNPFEGTEGADDPDNLDTHATTGVFTDFDIESIDGVNVIPGDKRLVIPASDAPEDDAARERFTIVQDGEENWQVCSCKKVQPGDTPLAYFFHVRLMPSQKAEAA